MQVGQYSDQTYQQYILKALGELVLYVDGMHGLIQCNEIIQWLYELTRSKVHTHTPCMQYRDREVSLSLSAVSSSGEGNSRSPHCLCGLFRA